MKNCLICDELAQNAWLKTPDGKEYLRCSRCELVWLAPQFRVSLEREKARYLQHNNHLEDPSYINYLARLFDQMRPFLAAHSVGLDFGCGPVKGLEFLLAKEDFSLISYDPIFFSHAKLQHHNYDFIFCSEVAEHFFNPLEGFKELDSLLKKKAILGISSHFYPVEKDAFENWNYRRDFTHVVFYSEKTVHYLANLFGWKILSIQSPFWVMQK